MPQKTLTTNREILIQCNSVWKLYGINAGAIAAKHHHEITSELLRRKGVISAARDVTFNIYKGEVFVIMGLSGSGKSTMLRCMTGLSTPTLGSLKVSGIDLKTASPKTLNDIRRHTMGMVFQSFALLPHLTVLENIAFPLRVQGVPKAERLAQARKMMELVGLSGRETHWPHELSGGQQQRVGIARSLTTDPEVWFLDEPFSALDPLIRLEMQNEFLRLQSMLHKSIVFVTHDFDEAVRLADRIAIMEGGRVVQIGTPEELITNPANDYVAEFTGKIPRSKVVKVRTIMGAAASGLQGRPIDESSLVADIAEQVLTAGAPVPVQNKDGQIVGALDARKVAAVLLNKDMAA
ncbi:glycine betaine/L-proline ABC transporter ATP-binding protein [Leisingera sp. XS_AS12]|uniref:quaternary amine ABC transporter ATP-binding protein n=1 Tax=Leisingera sp. XS_AS12 TaxID=3241294 RepID=UPI00351797E1